MAGRPRTWVIGGSLAALVAVAVVTWLLTRPDTYTADPPAERIQQPDPVAAAHALTLLERDVATRDRSAVTRLAPADDRGAAVLLQQVVDNAEALHVDDFTARYIDETDGVDAHGRWPAEVDLTWRFEGYDRDTVHEEVQVGFEDRDGAVGITGFGGGDDRTPLWLAGPLQVRRTPDSLVLATTSADASLLSQRAAAAVAVVHRVLPDWRGRPVVEVPGSEDQLEAELGADQGSLGQIAAVTASVDGTVAPDSDLHVFVNPTVYNDLDPVGGQVVLSHETTHLATKAPLVTGVPKWLLEGFADYVALRDVTLPISTTAGQILAQVRRSGPPKQLPDATEFEAQADGLGATYEAAWLACRTLADRGGESALVHLYQQVSRGQDFTARLKADFGLNPAQLTNLWRQRLQHLADTTKGRT